MDGHFVRAYKLCKFYFFFAPGLAKPRAGPSITVLLLVTVTEFLQAAKHKRVSEPQRGQANCRAPLRNVTLRFN